MLKFKLRRGSKIGDLAAENDKLLASAFIDQGHLDALIDTECPQFLILGRTGSGKTALIQQMKARVEHFSVLNPEELSMQYIHNSPILKELMKWGVNLDIFYKFLWRHVCVLQIIRMRYGDAQEVPGIIQRAIALVSTSIRNENRAMEAAKDYMLNYGDQFWTTTDTRIKKIVDEVEHRVKNDSKLGARLRTVGLDAGVGSNSMSGSRVAQTVERELVDRAQSIVSNYLIADLKQVIDILGKAGFNDPQKGYYLLVDDLDREWMPDDVLYLDLTKSLLQTAYDINRGSPLKGVKIILALRENIYHRVFQKAKPHEPQREKWLDVQIRLKWTKKELEELVDFRLRELYRTQYTQAGPSFRDVLPTAKRRSKQDPVEFIFERTFMRPRDVIDFVNTAMADAGSFSRLSWSNLTRAETEYSSRRRQSVFDEWMDSYFSLPLFFPMLTKLGVKFTLDQIREEDLNLILDHKRAEQCRWLSGLQTLFCSSANGSQEVKIEILKALYLVGLIGVKQPHSHHVLYGFDQSFDSSPEILANTTFHIHKMFWNSLGLSAEVPAKTIDG